MPLISRDRVKETTTTTGNGLYVALGGASDGFQSFADGGFGTAYFGFYTLVSGTAWETGIGFWHPSAGWGRNEVYENSNGDTDRISLTGTSDLFVSLPGKRALHTLEEMPFSGEPSRAKLKQTSSQNFADSTWNKVTFDSAEVASSGSITADTTNNKLTLLDKGTYVLSGQVSATDSMGCMSPEIWLAFSTSSSADDDMFHMTGATTNGSRDDLYASLSAIHYVTESTDIYLYCFAYDNCMGDGLDASVAYDRHKPRLAAVRVL